MASPAMVADLLPLLDTLRAEFGESISDSDTMEVLGEVSFAFAVARRAAEAKDPEQARLLLEKAREQLARLSEALNAEQHAIAARYLNLAALIVQQQRWEKGART